MFLPSFPSLPSSSFSPLYMLMLVCIDIVILYILTGLVIQSFFFAFISIHDIQFVSSTFCNKIKLRVLTSARSCIRYLLASSAILFSASTSINDASPPASSSTSGSSVASSRKPLHGHNQLHSTKVYMDLLYQLMPSSSSSPSAACSTSAARERCRTAISVSSSSSSSLSDSNMYIRVLSPKRS